MNRRVEGLWIVYAGEVYRPDFRPGGAAAGLVVLDRGRLYGGDGNYYWVGRYEARGNALTARASTHHYSGSNRTPFGFATSGLEVEVQGSRVQPDVIAGVVRSPAAPSSLPIIMVKKQGLP